MDHSVNPERERLWDEKIRKDRREWVDFSGHSEEMADVIISYNTKRGILTQLEFFDALAELRGEQGTWGTEITRLTGEVAKLIALFPDTFCANCEDCTCQK